jgi:hypothetical protein
MMECKSIEVMESLEMHGRQELKAYNQIQISPTKLSRTSRMLQARSYQWFQELSVLVQSQNTE